MLIGVIDAPVMLGLEGVFRPGRIRVAVVPEGLDEEIALPVGLQLEEDLPFEGRDDIGDILIQPFLVGRGQGGRLIRDEGARGESQGREHGDCR